MDRWFISDTHFNHNGIIHLASRPFENAEEMNEALINSWNSFVGLHDIVYHLGDFMYRNSLLDITEIIGRLNGNIQLILGNHDINNIRKSDYKYFTWVGNYKTITINNQRYVLFHYPIHSWDGIHKGHIHLHGHTHNNIVDPKKNRVSVCVELLDYRPINLEELKQLVLLHNKLVEISDEK